MNLKEYQKRAMETAIYPRPTKPAEYPFWALMREVAEFYGADNPEMECQELGDILWMVAAIAYEMDFILDGDFPRLESDFVVGVDMLEHSSMIADVICKAMRDKKWAFGCAMDEEMKIRISTYFNLIIEDAAKHCDFIGISLEEVAEMNIAKLESRKARGVIGGSGDNR